MSFHSLPLPTGRPVLQIGSPFLFLLDQCRRFAATRDGLGATPIDHIATDLAARCARPDDAWRLFGLVHDLVRFLATVREQAFDWRPELCSPSRDEQWLVFGLQAALGTNPAALRDLGGHLVAPRDIPALTVLLGALARAITAEAAPMAWPAPNPALAHK